MTNETIDHLLHPRTAAEQLQAIFAGKENADDGRIAALAKQLFMAATPVDPAAFAPHGSFAQPAPHQVAVTRLAPGFDHNDRRSHEYVIGNDIVGWTSHQVTHPDACHRLPYGQLCWFDEEWHNGEFDYGGTEPGLYNVTPGHQDVGDHHGEYSHTEDYLDYQRIGDAPQRPAQPEPVGGYSDEAPF